MEAKIKELGWIEKGTGKHQSNTVYDIGGVSPTVTIFGEKLQPTMFIEVIKIGECKSNRMHGQH